MREPRPFLEDGSQFGVSRTAFRRMRKAEKLELMIGWFHQNFEDPAQSTPYESAEGGYQWIWGGPYEARDELYSKFGDIVSESFIEEAVKEIESDGIVDWAPVHTGDDYDEPEPPEDPISLDIYLDEPSDRYGSLEEQEVRARAREAIDELREALERPRPVGIGHNRPPEEEEEPEEIAELRPAIAELSAELAKPSPTIALIKRWATPLRSALIACAQWGLKKIDGGIDATVKAGMVGGAGWLENGSPLTASTANNHWDILLLARWSGVLTLAGLVAISLAIGHLLGGPAEDDRTALAIACATRHIGIAVLIATSVPGPRTSVLVAFYTLTSAVISIPYLRWRRASASRGKVSWARRGPGFFRKLIAGAQSLSGSHRRRLLRSNAGTSHVAGHWRKLNPNAELMVDPGRGARSAIRDAEPPGQGRYHWTVTVLGEPDPMASGRTGGLREARAEGALLAYVEGRDWPSGGGIGDNG